MKQFEHDILDPYITNNNPQICGLCLMVFTTTGLIISGLDTNPFFEVSHYV